MRGISGILRNLFASEGEVSYERARDVCAAAGFTDLNIGTFRTTKSLWNRERRISGVPTVAATVATLEAPVENPVAVVSHDFGDIPEYTFDDDVTDNIKGYFVPPKIDDTHVINKDLQAMFDAIHKASFKRPQNVRLNGPAGCGKTTTAMEFAARYNRPMLVMDCALVREPRDWFGYRDIDKKTGTPFWHKSLFFRFVQHHGAVIVLDEINRVSQGVINSLLPLLDDRRKTYLEEAGSTVQVGKNVVFFGTTNEGREYSGTVSFDFAQADRLCTLIEATYLPENEESKLLHTRTGLGLPDCTKLVQVANHVRKKAASDSADTFSKSISTRMLLNAAEKMHFSGPSTLRYTLLSHYSSDGGEQSERGQLLKLLQGKFGPVFG